ncbi:MAG: bifunctional metallophosphatase/5'-nucleotidase, partial [Erysipelotrichaceae bacterium]|nr:bifunctional metallophosphatase/5'-nucleotidase [Erysipelotrichaceae bacterium]
MDEIKKLVLLHNNDMHGAFLPETVDGREVGGIARLAGKINQIRDQYRNTIFAIAGDMFRGSVIDSEFRGA